MVAPFGPNRGGERVVDGGAGLSPKTPADGADCGNPRGGTARVVGHSGRRDPEFSNPVVEAADHRPGPQPVFEGLGQ